MAYGHKNDLVSMFKDMRNHYVKRVIVHPDYHLGRNWVPVNDIALLGRLNLNFLCILIAGACICDRLIRSTERSAGSTGQSVSVKTKL